MKKNIPNQSTRAQNQQIKKPWSGRNPLTEKMANCILKNQEIYILKNRMWQWPSRNNILSAIMVPRKKTTTTQSPSPDQETIYEKCLSRGSQTGFKSLLLWILQVFSTIAIYTCGLFLQPLLPQWVFLHSTSALSKSNRWEKSVSKQWAGKPVSFFPFLPLMYFSPIL